MTQERKARIVNAKKITDHSSVIFYLSHQDIRSVDDGSGRYYAHATH